MEKFFRKKNNSQIPVICPRESYAKETNMQILHEEYSDNSWVLSPIMFCHNEYGLERCFDCKQKLYEYLLDLEKADSKITEPIHL